jgi:hypothetical protein
MVNEFTPKDIAQGLEKLVHRFSKINIYLSILDQYYYGNFEITRKTMPLSLILTELAAHICGQLTRLCFDKAKSYKTVSIAEIYNQIFLNSNKASGRKHKEKFDSAGSLLQQLKSTYEDKLKSYCDKHYAHCEISLKESESDYENFKIGWNEIAELVEGAKSILNAMNLYWLNEESDFADNCKDELEKRFWKLICLPDRSSIDYWN